jgi:flagellar hook-length control protein FliK
LKPTNAHGPRPTPADRAPATPFETLLDDNDPPAPDTAPRTARSDDKAPADRSTAKSDKSKTSDDGRQSQSATEPDDGKETAKAKGDGNTETANDGKTDGKSDAKTAEQTLAPDGGKPADGKDVTTDAKTDAAPLTPEAIAAAVAAPDAGIEPVAPALSAPATTAPAQKLVQATLNVTQPDPTTAAPDAPAPDKAVPALAGDAKQQAAAKYVDKDADKDVAQHAHSGEPIDSHRAAQAQSALDGGTPDAAPKSPNGAPTLTLATQPQSAQPAAATLSTPQALPQAAAIPLSGVAVEIAGKALAGKNRFEIRLDPPDLGRIDVRLDIDRDGNITSRLIADRADTLDLLRRDAAGLERALQDAGLKTSDNGLQFSLRDQSMGREQNQSGFERAQLVVSDDTAPTDTLPRDTYRRTGPAGGLDIRV